MEIGHCNNCKSLICVCNETCKYVVQHQKGLCGNCWEKLKLAHNENQPSSPVKKREYDPEPMPLSRFKEE